MTSNFSRNVTAAICAILFSATMVLGTVGPIPIQTPEASGNPA